MRVRKLAGALLGVALAFSLATSSAFGAASATYNIPGVTNGNEDLYAFTFGVHSQFDSTFKEGTSVGKAEFNELQMDSSPNPGSPSVFRAAAAGRRLPSARIDFTLGSPFAGAVMSYCFEDVYITDFQQFLSGGDNGVQRLSLAYRKLTYQFAFGNTTVATVDVAQGTATLGGSC